MRIKDLAVVAVRVFAVWVLFSCIVMFEQIPLAFLYPSGGNDSFTRFYSFLNMFNLALYLAVGLVLLVKTDRAAAFLVRGTGGDTGAEINAADLAILAFGVAGLVVFIDGVETVLAQVVTYYAPPEMEAGRGLLARKFNPAAFGAGLVKAAFGLALLLSPKGIVGALKWTRVAATDRRAR